MLCKVDEMHSLLRNPLKMIIGQEMEKEGLDQIINGFYISLSIRLLLR